MMRPDRDVISTRQAGLFIMSIMVGKGLLFLPRTITAGAGTAAWWIEDVAGLVALLGIWVIVAITRRFPGETFIDYAPRVIGRLPTNAVMLVFIGFFVLIATLTLRAFTEVLSLSILPQTPVNATLFILLLACAYPAYQGMETLVRVNCLVGLVAIVSMFGILVMGLQQNIDPGRLKPFFDIRWEGFSQSLSAAVYSLLGFETLLFLGGYIETKEPGRLGRALAWGVGTVILLYTFVIIAVIVAFGVDPIHYMVWPLVDYAKVAGFPETILERLEFVTVSVWIMAVFTTVNAYLYLGRIVMARLLKMKDTQGKYLLFPIVAIVYALGLTMPNARSVLEVVTMTNRWAPLLVLGVPIAVWTSTVVRHIPRSGR